MTEDVGGMHIDGVEELGDRPPGQEIKFDPKEVLGPYGRAGPRSIGPP